jgi:hypothetical protein
MTRALRGHRFGSWLALLGLVLQLGLSAAHSAQHFDHLLGPLGARHTAPVAAEPAGRADAPAPAKPASPDRGHCAVDLCLAATGHIVLTEPALAPLRLEFEIACLDAGAPSVISAVRRHNLPPARAPPVIEIS